MHCICRTNKFCTNCHTHTSRKLLYHFDRSLCFSAENFFLVFFFTSSYDQFGMVQSKDSSQSLAFLCIYVHFVFLWLCLALLCIANTLHSTEITILLQKCESESMRDWNRIWSRNGICCKHQLHGNVHCFLWQMFDGNWRIRKLCRCRSRIYRLLLSTMRNW